MPNSQKSRRVTEVLEMLKINEIRKSLVGGSSRRGISGGELKRVSVACEMVSRPPLFYLDEPTTGLDAAIALELVKSLREVAVKENIAVVMAIHQPRVQIVDLFDAIILLQGGRMVYQGPGKYLGDHFKACGHVRPQLTDESNFVMDVLLEGGDSVAPLS
eukprot:Trichotokara_eunicae@DN6766_c0_g1_i1.p1